MSPAANPFPEPVRRPGYPASQEDADLNPSANPPTTVYAWSPDSSKSAVESELTLAKVLDRGLLLPGFADDSETWDIDIPVPEAA